MDYYTKIEICTYQFFAQVIQDGIPIYQIRYTETISKMDAVALCQVWLIEHLKTSWIKEADD